MRAILPSAILATSLSVASHASAGPVPTSDVLHELRGRWHRCVQQTYAEQSSSQSRASSQRNALDACKEYEDAYVAAVMASLSDGDEAMPEGDHAMAIRARVWVTSALAYILDPVANWFGRKGR